MLGYFKSRCSWKIMKDCFINDYWLALFPHLLISQYKALHYVDLSVYLSINIYMYSMHGCDNHKTLISFCFRNISRVMLRVRVCWQWNGPISMAVVETKTQTHRNRTAFLCCSMPVKMMCLMLEVRMSRAPWWLLPLPPPPNRYWAVQAVLLLPWLLPGIA